MFFVTDCRFMCYLPSAMATATMLYVISSLEPFSAVEHQDQLIAILGIKKVSIYIHMDQIFNSLLLRGDLIKNKKLIHLL